MHGRLKVRTTAEEAARKKKEQELKVKVYRSSMAVIFEKRKLGALDGELLSLTGKVLSRNADIYTLWNIRKECIRKMESDCDIEKTQEMYDKDLYFSEQCLMVNPKSYGAWHHRCWVLENCPNPDWKKEIELCGKYLKLDERNFHCWDYRRFIASKAEIPKTKELEFCTEKIKNNFSNYSSWHYRSKLLPDLYPHETNTARPISEKKLKDELELVLTAAFTDPNDSSAWFYQRWLLGYSQPACDLAAFRISADMAVIAFTIPVDISRMELYSNLGIDFNTFVWRAASSGNKHDKIWFACNEWKLPHVEANASLSCTSKDNQKFCMELQKGRDGFFGINCPRFEYEFGSAVLEELKSQLDSCNQLLEYEPDSKWTLLTAALLMRAVDRQNYHAKSLDYLKQLQTVDYMRKGYYKDLGSKWIIENKIENWVNSEIRNFSLDLSGNQLSSIFYEQYLSILDEINFDENDLSDRCLIKLGCLVFCQEINFGRNKISNLKQFPLLPKLKSVSFMGNNILKDTMDETLKKFITL